MKKSELNINIVPPWEKYPEAKSFTDIWRKGNEDGYLDDWSNWFSNLSLENRQKYTRKYPEPRMWNGFYKQLEKKYLQ